MITNSLISTAVPSEIVPVKMAGIAARHPALLIAGGLRARIATLIICAALAGWAARADALPLEAAASFSVLGGSAVTNTGSTIVYGDVGVSPGTSITGFGPGVVVDGALHSKDSQANAAHADTVAAYLMLAAEVPAINYSGRDLGTLTLTPGVYHFDSSAQLTGTLILDNRLDPGGRFHFQIGSTLTTAANAKVLLLGGSDDNVFWQIGSSATIGAEAEFRGNILAQTSITFGTGAVLINGRALAIDGAVTLDSNFINVAERLAEPVSAVPEPGNWIFGAAGFILLAAGNCGRRFRE